MAGGLLKNKYGSQGAPIGNDVEVNYLTDANGTQVYLARLAL